MTWWHNSPNIGPDYRDCEPEDEEEETNAEEERLWEEADRRYHEWKEEQCSD